MKSEKQEPIEIESIGEDVYTVMSRGHHDPHEFMQAVRADGYDWPLEFPRHEWMRTVPATKNSGFRFMYCAAKPNSRGAFPVTYASEGYGNRSYEFVAKQGQSK